MERKFIKLPLLPHSRKNYSHGKTFGAVPLDKIPAELDLTTEILNQGFTEECTAYTAVEIRESMKGTKYDPDKFWAEELKMLGNPNAQGSDLKTQMAVGVKVGFYPIGSDKPQDNASAYFSVYKTGGYDLFDCVRSALAQTHIPISAGVEWFEDWDYTAIIPDSFKKPLGGHDIKLAGLHQINGEDHITIQNSWGMDFGDNGKFYLNRKMANKILDQGLYYWVDSTDQKIKTMGLLSSLLTNLINLLTRLALGLGFTK
jgi:hypothetical protein